ncbi:hypothetical protein DPV78_003666 [Talaromyces pinophilus]|nr:hypothetical protein DPV78_003666 [Talaromyces pinophilus]
MDSTDPANFNLYLINDDRLPSVSIEIASNVSTTAGSYSFDGVDVVPSSGYRFTFKDTSNNDLLVQSDTFSIVAKGDDTTTVTSGTSTSATSATAYPASSSTTATTTRLNASSTSSPSGSSPTSHSLGTVSQIPSSPCIAGLVVLLCASML